MPPIISVIIPAYNAEKTIFETIESVLQQTFSDFEIIVIDDGSTDRTLETVNFFQDHRIKCFSFQNGGLPVARNRGINLAKGEFLAFLDADDLWTSRKLEKQLNALKENPDSALAYSWVHFKFDQDDHSYSDCSCSFHGNVYADLLVRNFLHNGSNPLVRKHVINEVGKFDQSLRSCEDWDFYIRVAAKYNFELVRDVQIIYRQSSESMSSKIDTMEEYLLIVINKLFKTAPLEYQPLKKQSLAWAYCYVTQQHLRNQKDWNSINKSFQKLFKAIRLQPLFLFKGYTKTLMLWLAKAYIKMFSYYLLGRKASK